ncbi:LysR family transcriptional regulator [Achromobacter aloeverae]|uniref:LysR family transcriptional regulator n=1 Tax=Achromobacter aloeverae TaxID=1750518 RepID=UPI001863D562|nr:LysR family transcriptional regulator [Achromobacter aloeverae]
MRKKSPERLERRHVDLLVTIARHGSIHAAARALGIAQPLATSLLQDAERIAGRQLFSRSHRGCVPLADAHELLRGVRYAAKALHSLDVRNGQPQVKLRLGCIPRVTHTFVPELMDALGREAPDVAVEIVEGTTSALDAQLNDGEIDVFMGRRPPGLLPGDGHYVIENMYEEKTVVIAARGHPLAARRKASLEELTAYPWILPRQQSYSRNIWGEVFVRAGLAPPRAMIESLSFLSNVHLAARSACLSIAPDRIAAQFQDSGLISIIETGLNLGDYMVVLVHHETIAAHPSFEQFMAAARHAGARLAGGVKPKRQRRGA